MNEELLERLGTPEDNFIERKPDGAKREELRKTIVAFANSVPEGRTGVLYIGVRDSGDIQGVQNPDSLQKTIQSICTQDCYPPISYQSEVLPIDNRNVVAVVIPRSVDGPHFSGPAYVRRGSQSITASEEVFNELLTCRLAKPAEILKRKGDIITVVARGKELGSTKILGDPRYRARHECRVEGCTAHAVRLFDLATGKYVSEPLENITISFDDEQERLMLVAQER